MIDPVRRGAVVVGLAAVALPLQAPRVSTRALVDAAAQYVARYEQQLTSIVADEAYTQEIVEQSPRDPEMPRRRSLRSEVFFLFAPGEGDWMAIRDVLVVDGNAVPDRPDIGEALQRLRAREVAATFKRYNSRYNIGRTHRNFNEPTLSLLVLDERHRERFSFSASAGRAADPAVATLSFTEKERPPLIMDPARGPAFSKGELEVERATGRIRRAVLRARVDRLSVGLTTIYGPDDRLGMWLPIVFREDYEYGARSNSNLAIGGSEYEQVACEARYSNFRRFETQVRIR
jgi:hypothetical protein